MSTKQVESGLGIGPKVGIAAVAVLLVGVLVLSRGGDEPVDPAPVEAAKPVVEQPKPAQRQLGNRFERVQSATDAESKAAAMRANVEAQAKQREQPAAPRTDTKVDIDKDPDDIPTLKRVVLEDSDPERRLAAVTLLGISDNPEAIGVLAQALSDEDENVRMEAVLALADFTEEAPVEVLAHAMNDPSAEIRYEALDVLSDIETAESTHVVQAALNDPDEDVRELAEIILDLRSDETE